MDAAELKPLTERQRRFVEEYVAEPNAVQAYFRAFGRVWKNKDGKQIRRSYRAARNQASTLLANPNIQAELAAARRELARRCRITADRVVRELAIMAFADPADVVDPETNEPLMLCDMTVAGRRSVASIEVERLRSVGDPSAPTVIEKCKIKQHDKGANLDRLAKHLGLYAENNALEAILGQLPDTLRQQVIAALAHRRSNPTNG